MKQLLLFLSVFFAASTLSAQPASAPTWSDDVAPIVYEKCGTCHNPGGIAPFSLLTYAEAAQYAPILEYAVTSGHMPPWPPDPNYSHFAGERVLTEQERATIVAWVQSGAAQGDPAATPAPPQYAVGGMLPGTPDLVLKIPAYTVTTTDDIYRCFSLPTGLTEDRFVTRLEIVPGNRSIVHHVDTYYDLDDDCVGGDSLDVLPGFNCFGNVCDYYQKTFYNWSPGGDPAVYPPGMGKRLPANSSLVMEIHYAPGSDGLTDSTELRLWFAPVGEPIREVVAASWASAFGTLLNPPFVIPPDSVSAFHTRKTINQKQTLLRVSPHMHLLGASSRAWMLTPQGDTVPLIDIPKWDFHWQGYYTFPKPVIVAAGAKVETEFVFDNTADNPWNPNFPPEPVEWGETTKDEMLILFVEYVKYQPGDEDLVLDSSLVEDPTTPVHPAPLAEQFALRVAPNPSNGAPVRFDFTLREAGAVSLSLYDAQGRLVRELLRDERRPAGAQLALLPAASLAPGCYYAVLRTENGGTATQKLVVL
jgi:hypothetical protein